jgi:hypothetical protein
MPHTLSLRGHQNDARAVLVPESLQREAAIWMTGLDSRLLLDFSDTISDLCYGVFALI